MLYAITVILTTLVFFAILIIINRKNKKLYSRKIYRQSDMHNMLKVFFLLDLKNDNSFSSQIKKRKEKQTTNVIILKDKAYWVKDNIFYVGNTSNGEVLPETGVPIDTNTLSESEINKLLFILDRLKGGNNNDSGSTGNK